MAKVNFNLKELLLAVIGLLALQQVQSRYIAHPVYPHAYHGSPALHGGYFAHVLPFHYQPPLYPPPGTFYDKRRGILRTFSGGGVPVLVDYYKRCSNDFIGIKPHPNQRQYYYVCKPDCVIFGKCQNLHIFNATKGQCSPLPNVEFAPVCTREGRFPIPSDCYIYYRCDCNLKARIYSCPQNTVFSAAQSKCVPGNQCAPTEISNNGSYIPQNCEDKFPPCDQTGTFRSPSDCSLYYTCSMQPSGVYLQTRFKCPGDNFYDVEKKSCRPKKDVPCDCIQVAELIYPRPPLPLPPPLPAPCASGYPHHDHSGSFEDGEYPTENVQSCSTEDTSSSSVETSATPSLSTDASTTDLTEDVTGTDSTLTTPLTDSSPSSSSALPTSINPSSSTVSTAETETTFESSASTAGTDSSSISTLPDDTSSTIDSSTVSSTAGSDSTDDTSSSEPTSSTNSSPDTSSTAVTDSSTDSSTLSSTAGSDSTADTSPSDPTSSTESSPNTSSTTVTDSSTDSSTVSSTAGSDSTDDSSSSDSTSTTDSSPDTSSTTVTDSSTDSSTVSSTAGSESTDDTSSSEPTSSTDSSPDTSSTAVTDSSTDSSTGSSTAESDSTDDTSSSDSTSPTDSSPDTSSTAVTDSSTDSSTVSSTAESDSTDDTSSSDSTSPTDSSPDTSSTAVTDSSTDSSTVSSTAGSESTDDTSSSDSTSTTDSSSDTSSTTVTDSTVSSTAGSDSTDDTSSSDSTSSTDSSPDTSSTAVTDSSTDSSTLSSTAGSDSTADTSPSEPTSSTESSTDTSSTAATDSSTDSSTLSSTAGSDSTADTSSSEPTSSTDSSTDTSSTTVTDSSTDSSTVSSTAGSESTDDTSPSESTSTTDSSPDTSSTAITDSSTDSSTISSTAGSDSTDDTSSSEPTSSTDSSPDTSSTAVTDSSTDSSTVSSTAGSESTDDTSSSEPTSSTDSSPDTSSTAVTESSTDSSTGSSTAGSESTDDTSPSDSTSTSDSSPDTSSTAATDSSTDSSTLSSTAGSDSTADTSSSEPTSSTDSSPDTSSTAVTDSSTDSSTGSSTAGSESTDDTSSSDSASTTDSSPDTSSTAITDSSTDSSTTSSTAGSDSTDDTSSSEPTSSTDSSPDTSSTAVTDSSTDSSTVSSTAESDSTDDTSSSDSTSPTDSSPDTSSTAVTDSSTDSSTISSTAGSDSTDDTSPSDSTSTTGSSSESSSTAGTDSTIESSTASSTAGSDSTSSSSISTDGQDTTTELSSTQSSGATTDATPSSGSPTSTDASTDDESTTQDFTSETKESTVQTSEATTGAVDSTTELSTTSESPTTKSTTEIDEPGMPHDRHQTPATEPITNNLIHSQFHDTNTDVEFPRGSRSTNFKQNTTNNNNLLEDVKLRSSLRPETPKESNINEHEKLSNSNAMHSHDIARNSINSLPLRNLEMNDTQMSSIVDGGIPSTIIGAMNPISSTGISSSIHHISVTPSESTERKAVDKMPNPEAKNSINLSGSIEEYNYDDSKDEDYWEYELVTAQDQGETTTESLNHQNEGEHRESAARTLIPNKSNENLLLNEVIAPQIPTTERIPKLMVEPIAPIPVRLTHSFDAASLAVPTKRLDRTEFTIPDTITERTIRNAAHENSHNLFQSNEIGDISENLLFPTLDMASTTSQPSTMEKRLDEINDSHSKWIETMAQQKLDSTSTPHSKPQTMPNTTDPIVFSTTTTIPNTINATLAPIQTTFTTTDEPTSTQPNSNDIGDDIFDNKSSAIIESATPQPTVSHIAVNMDHTLLESHDIIDPSMQHTPHSIATPITVNDPSISELTPTPKAIGEAALSTSTTSKDSSASPTTRKPPTILNTSTHNVDDSSSDYDFVDDNEILEFSKLPLGSEEEQVFEQKQTTVVNKLSTKAAASTHEAGVEAKISVENDSENGSTAILNAPLGVPEAQVKTFEDLTTTTKSNAAVSIEEGLAKLQLPKVLRGRALSASGWPTEVDNDIEYDSIISNVEDFENKTQNPQTVQNGLENRTVDNDNSNHMRTTTKDAPFVEKIFENPTTMTTPTDTAEEAVDDSLDVSQEEESNIKGDDIGSTAANRDTLSTKQTLQNGFENRTVDNDNSNHMRTTTKDAPLVEKIFENPTTMTTPTDTAEEAVDDSLDVSQEEESNIKGDDIGSTAANGDTLSTTQTLLTEIGVMVPTPTHANNTSTEHTPTATKTTTTTTATTQPNVATFESDHLDIEFDKDIIEISSKDLRTIRNAQTTQTQKPVTNPNQNLVTDSCNPVNGSIPKLEIKVFRPLDLRIIFCPESCNRTHQHIFEREMLGDKRAVGIKWIPQNSNNTLSLQTAK